MTAFKALAGVTEQERTRGHQGTAERRAVLEAAGHDDPDRYLRMPLFERAVHRAERADHVLHRPPVAPGQEPTGRPPGGAARGPPGQRPVQLDRNFSQDEDSRCRVTWSNIDGAGLNSQPRSKPGPPRTS